VNALHTRCPRCATTFRVTAELLEVADGLVRCGSCDEVFDARSHEVNLEATGSDTPPPGMLNADYIDDLLREPGVAPQGEAEPPSAPAAPAMALPDALPAEAAPPDALALQILAQAPPQAPLVALPVELGGTPRRRLTLRVLAWLAMLAAVGLALGAQYAWLEREHLAQDPGVRVHLERVCGWLGCQVPPYHDPRAIRSTELLVRPDPARTGVLLVDAVLENRAPFPQRYPDLELSFTDMQGRPVARRVFAPREYLGAHPAPDALLASREPVRVHLELMDPGEHATSYELRLIEPGQRESGAAAE
jgi:predicted Zn finger-like uncharacterized protein